MPYPLIITVEDIDAICAEIIAEQDTALAEGIASGKVVPFPKPEDR
jgi:hypothetical protein